MPYPLQIILVNPQLSENIGMTARAMMNCGLYDLRIVKPKENHLSDKAISASSNAEEILYNAKIYQTTSDAIADLNIVYATTARSRNQIKNVYNADKATQILNEKLEQNQKCGIMFGPERTGLHNEDVCLCDAIINIPLNPKHCSLNLSQAVLLVGYEFFKNNSNTPKTITPVNQCELSSKENILRFVSKLEADLKNCGNFKIDEKNEKMIINLRNIFIRNNLTTQELNTLYGVINYLSSSKK